MEEKSLILVVEDSRTQAAILRSLLQRNGYDVVVASDGMQALEMARETRPTLVIADILMPNMDGYGLCHALKTDAVLASIPVLLLTSLWDVSDIVQGLQVGADYYLTKPYDAEYLLRTVEEILLREPKMAVEGASEEIELEFEGRKYPITANRRQMLNLLLSTYGNAVLQNRILQQTQHELRTLNAKLVAQRQQIEAQQRELQEANARLHAMANRDSLTGVCNHRALQERLKSEMERFRRTGAPLSIVIADVDSFKSFNDTFGHQAGDEVLQSVAHIMEQEARACDFVARYGGEEFVVLMPDTSQDDALTATERIRLSIEKHPWTKRAVTASFGIATARNSHDKSSDLLALADKALYLSKSKGRNCVTHSTELSRANS